MSRSRRRDTRIGGGSQGAFTHAPRVTRKELIECLVRRRRRELIEQGILEDPRLRPPRFTFFWEYDGQAGEVHADDRSTARSMIKTLLGIPKKKRLPFEVTIIREAYDKMGTHDGCGVAW